MQFKEERVVCVVLMTDLTLERNLSRGDEDKTWKEVFKNQKLLFYTIILFPVHHHNAVTLVSSSYYEVIVFDFTT